MIEFRSDKGCWECTEADNECCMPARAIVQDGRWYYAAACDNEAHAAEALALHAEFVDAEGPSVVWEHVEQCWPWPEPGAKHPRFKQAA